MPEWPLGATLVMPGSDLSPTALADLIEGESVSIAAGVPTIWMGVLPELPERDTSALRSVVCGGSPCHGHCRRVSERPPVFPSFKHGA
ncbi:MAG: hypothetical protein CM1200mP26_19850 [Acidimicrobiales bacterium]|nr:MAG: hypothetical protein CM1200mP26_19850 [Acidimicrobiales bacterium]